MARLAHLMQGGGAVSTGDVSGGDPVASHLSALRARLVDDPAGLSLVDGLSAYLDPAHPLAVARRVAAYAEPTGSPLPPEVKDPPPNYTVTQAAQLLGVSRWWVRRRIQAGTVDAYRLGREYRIRQAEMDRLLDGGAA
jgi:excisionase family DNA binding protein